MPPASSSVGIDVTHGLERYATRQRVMRMRTGYLLAGLMLCLALLCTGATAAASAPTSSYGATTVTVEATPATTFTADGILPRCRDVVAPSVCPTSAESSLRLTADTTSKETVSSTPWTAKVSPITVSQTTATSKATVAQLTYPATKPAGMDVNNVPTMTTAGVDSVFA